ncbi:hypothetical protein WJX73_001315 [Symbiochloris irregularis]|uniref:Uncharacterized protein n=1 Tax=Symbiochloris irregularis TaxID=706552 RepID=A0AAW1NT59_9CHLO
MSSFPPIGGKFGRPQGVPYFTTKNLFGQGEIDIGAAFGNAQNCNYSSLPLADFLSVTGNTNAFCNIGFLPPPGVANNQQPPYKLKLTTTSSFQPSSLNPFGREQGFGRRLQQNFAGCGRGSTFPSVLSQYGAKASSKFPGLYYSVNTGTGAAAGYTLFGIHESNGIAGICRSNVLVIDNWLLIETVTGPSSSSLYCQQQGINFQASG